MTPKQWHLETNFRVTGDSVTLPNVVSILLSNDESG